MPRPRFTSPANRDIRGIVKYVASHDPAAAVRLLTRIESTCQMLADEPGAGQSREDLLPSLRFLPVGNYLIFYRPAPEEIQVIRVIHGARNYGADLF